jgi:N-acyl amino acid synthase of PEP-CTERM/exosortase system
MLNHGSDSDFAQSYMQYFDIVRADTSALLDEAYRIRYQVYCVENPFENAAQHSDARERDVDDDRSVHALLRHRATGAFAGTVRVILPDNGALQRPLPVHHLLGQQSREYLKRIAWRTTAEISRFAVSKQFRRRRNEERYADVLTPGTVPTSREERHVVPYITFGLIRAVLEICRENRIASICAVMEPALIRILSRFGVEFTPVGDMMEHHGLRQPCVARLDDVVERNRKDATLLWQYTAIPEPQPRYA